MKIKILIFSILILNSIFVFGQYEYMNYEPYEYENYNPKWTYIVIDSSVISDTFDVSGKKIIHDGWLQFGGDYSNNKPVINEGELYFYEIKKNDFFSGAYLGSLDIETGEKIWDTHFDFRNIDRKEYPGLFYINNNADLEMPVFRKKKTTGNGRGSYLAVRTYNKKKW